MIVRRLILVLIAGLIGVPAPSARADVPVPEPYLLVRSMRMLQDQVASGKPEALPMLNRVLGHVAEDLKQAGPDAWRKPANVYAVFIYLLNGGNPDVVRNIIAALEPGQIDPKLITGTLAYADGDTVRVIESFQQLPADIPTELTASIYLVTASQLAGIDAMTALRRLDYIRLNAPGTLLEEAALRRGLVIAARIGDKDVVKTYARNYLQRYEQSPYSEDFFRQLVDALLALKGKISESEIEEIASFAWPGAQLPLYLRIARGSIVSGDLSRARLASQKAVALAGALKTDETQAQLYLAVSNVGSDKTGEAERILSSLSKERLHDRDVKLLEAATTMADKILAQPAAIPIPGLPAKFLTNNNKPSSPKAAPVAKTQATPVAAEDAMITQAREKLDAIDAMLGKAKK